MTYYAIRAGDPFQVIRYVDMPTLSAACWYFLDQKLLPDESYEVVSQDELFTLRGKGAMSWVDEKLGG